MYQINSHFPQRKKQKKTIHTTQRESLVPVYYTNAIQSHESMLCPINFFVGCIMHVTYSYQHFSAFQMSILPLQFELNLNSFLYFNKNQFNGLFDIGLVPGNNSIKNSMSRSSGMPGNSSGNTS